MNDSNIHSPEAARRGDGKADQTLDVEETNHVLETEASITPGEERALVRKIDMVVLPLMCFVFFLQYLDKQSLSYAAVFGLLTDLDLTSEQYSWCSSIFYVGQLVAEYPFIYLMSKFPLTKLVGVTVVIWGGMCMCLAAPQSFASFAAVRFLLGFSEGAVSPAFVTITSIWYQKKEHATRTGLWVSMNGLAQVLGCLLMYGIGRNHSLALQPWRTLFLVCGGITCGAGMLFFFLMPSGPKDAWFLNAREKETLSLRMAKDREGGDKTAFSIRQLKETLCDAKAWFVFAFGILVTMQSPVLTFASLVIQSTGYDEYETMLYTAPSGAVQMLFLWIGVALCWIFPESRTFVAMVMCIPPLAANVVLMKLSVEAGWGTIVSAWLASCITAVMSPIMSLTSSNSKGNTKRAIVSAMFFIGYCVGCIASPQLWTERPRYFSGVVTAIVTWCLLIVSLYAYRLLCIRDNAARDRQESNSDADAGGFGSTTVVDGVLLDKNGTPETDLTDKEDRQFRYSY